MSAKTKKPNVDIAALLSGAFANQADQNKWASTDIEIAYEGTQIVLPQDPTRMGLETAGNFLLKKAEAAKQEYDVDELVAGAPWDTLQAVYKAIQSIYGLVISESIQTFFSDIKPEFVSINTGPGDKDRIQVPTGQMSLPGVKQPIHVRLTKRGTYVSATVNQAGQSILLNIAARAREILRTDSVYKAKAIRLNVDEEGNLGLDEQPEFLDLANVRESDMVHTKYTELAIRTNMFAPLKNTEACRKNKIPLKRGILLEGKYGTGKSLTAKVTAKVANDNGWTFIMLNRSQGLKAAIEFARNYQPCVIFAEDIDRAADREDEDVNDLVNLLDGVVSKDMEMMVVLTTNFIEKIDKALLRPGRFDAVITIQAPDAETGARIIRHFARDLLSPDAELDEVSEIIAGTTPAVFREVVERAKLSMLVEERQQVNAEDLLVSAVGMKNHMALLEAPANPPSAAERFTEAFTELLAGAMTTTSEEEDGSVSTRLKSFRQMVAGQFNKAESRDSAIYRAAAGAAAASKKNLEVTEETLELVKRR